MASTVPWSVSVSSRWNFSSRVKSEYVHVSLITAFVQADTIWLWHISRVTCLNERLILGEGHSEHQPNTSTTTWRSDTCHKWAISIFINVGMSLSRLVDKRYIGLPSGYGDTHLVLSKTHCVERVQLRCRDPEPGSRLSIWIFWNYIFASHEVSAT